MGSLITEAWARLVSANMRAGIKARAEPSFVHCQSKQVRNGVFFHLMFRSSVGVREPHSSLSPCLHCRLWLQVTTLTQKLANAQRVEVNRETIEGNDIPWSPAYKESVSHTWFPFPWLYSRKPRHMQKIST